MKWYNVSFILLQRVEKCRREKWSEWDAWIDKFSIQPNYGLMFNGKCLSNMERLKILVEDFSFLRRRRLCSFCVCSSFHGKWLIFWIFFLTISSWLAMTKNGCLVQIHLSAPHNMIVQLTISKLVVRLRFNLLNGIVSEITIENETHLNKFVAHNIRQLHLITTSYNQATVDCIYFLFSQLMLWRTRRRKSVR